MSHLSSTASLPSYHYEPERTEQRLAYRERLQYRPQVDFIKNTGGVGLRLSGQSDAASLPVYGRQDVVEGMVELAKPDSVQSVEVRIEGTLKLIEIAESGVHSTTLCLDIKTLWNRDRNQEPCPSSLAFSLVLPATFNDGKADYSLPPSFEAHLSGVPGFDAKIDYSVSVVIKNKGALFGSNTTVSTPFVYHPRTRPATPLPKPLTAMHPQNIVNEEWVGNESTMRAKSSKVENIKSFFYLPASRVFCIKEPIPFHVIFVSSAMTLAAFLPYAPSVTRTGQKSIMKIQILRQTVVDVRSISKRRVIVGHQTDIWKTICIGEGTFKHDGEGQDWTAWSGEVNIFPEVKIGGFKASGLTVRDFIVLSMTPPDQGKTLFYELRQGLPVRLTTDPLSGDHPAADIYGSDHSHGLPEDYLDNHPPLNY